MKTRSRKQKTNKKKSNEILIDVPEEINKSIDSETKYYFTDDTQQAIIDYMNASDDIKRNIIFNTRIYHAFHKLAENMINICKCVYIEEYYEDIKNDIVSFMALKMDKYNPHKGRAFSFFTKMVYNYLIISNKKSYRLMKRNDYLYSSLMEGFDKEDKSQAFDKQSDVDEFCEMFYDFWDNNLFFVFTDIKDIEIARVILDITKENKVKNLFKKTLYREIKHRTGYHNKHVKKVFDEMKIYYRVMVRDYDEDGVFINDMLCKKQSTWFE